MFPTLCPFFLNHQLVDGYIILYLFKHLQKYKNLYENIISYRWSGFFIGAHVVNELLRDGHKVVVLDDLSGGGV